LNSIGFGQAGGIYKVKWHDIFNVTFRVFS